MSIQKVHMSSARFLEWKRYVDKVKSEMVSRRGKFYALLIQRDGEKCAFCKKTESLEIDHVKPVINWGTNDLPNLRLLCKKCNAGRKDTHCGIPCMACGKPSTGKWGLKWLCQNCIDECEEEYQIRKEKFKKIIVSDVISRKKTVRH
jgi:hypothetical protein